MVTIKDIARLANVSVSTVSKALNDRPDIGEETKKKILEIAQQHHFTPNAYGKGLKCRTTENLGVILCRELQPLSGNPFYSRVLEGIEAEVALNNYNLVLHLLPEDSPANLPKMIRERQVDGLILVGVIQKQFIQKIVDDEFPVILIDPKITVDDCCQVLIDNEHGAFTATQFLIQAGHKKIGFISGDLSRLSFKQRYDGYLKALKFHKIPANDDYIQTGGLEQGYDHVKKLLLLKDKPTAIFAANDINAIFGYQAIHELDLTIPDQVSIVGFDDIELARLSTPPLTTIRVYKEEMGSIAVRTLLKIVNKEIEKPLTTIVPVRLIERDSVRRLKGTS